jgi:hypothetical protein
MPWPTPEEICMSQPVQLHDRPTPNGRKISIALEEMGLPYAVVAVNIGAGDPFEPGFQAISPNGRTPGPCCSDSAPGALERPCVAIGRRGEPTSRGRTVARPGFAVLPQDPSGA